MRQLNKAMGIITISVEDEVEARFRKWAAERFRNKKGFLGNAVTEAMKDKLKENEQKKIAEEAIALMNKGLKLGFKGYKSRDELYER